MTMLQAFGGGMISFVRGRPRFFVGAFMADPVLAALFGYLLPVAVFAWMMAVRLSPYRSASPRGSLLALLLGLVRWE
jgi:hypothetical protein